MTHKLETDRRYRCPACDNYTFFRYEGPQPLTDGKEMGLYSCRDEDGFHGCGSTISDRALIERNPEIVRLEDMTDMEEDDPA